MLRCDVRTVALAIGRDRQVSKLRADEFIGQTAYKITMRFMPAPAFYDIVTFLLFLSVPKKNVVPLCVKGRDFSVLFNKLCLWPSVLPHRIKAYCFLASHPLDHRDFAEGFYTCRLISSSASHIAKFLVRH
jgi:hypothetical protein